MQPSAYKAFTQQLTTSLQQWDNVLGLVLLGSTANVSHAPDEWSDHDFFVITKKGVQEQFRTQYDWLPQADQIVLAVRETQHGLKILYKNGHLLEYAVFDLDEIMLAKGNDYRVVFDKGGVAAAMQQIATTSDGPVATAVSVQRDMGMVLCLLVVGAGRVMRGETISGQVFIRTYAVDHLLSALLHVLDASDHTRLDNLDVYRRFESAFPVVGHQINAALNREPVAVALGLLEVFELYLSEIDNFPAGAVATVRKLLQS